MHTTGQHRCVGSTARSPFPLHPLHGRAAVSVKRQKLLGLKTKGGKPATDETAVLDLLLKPGQKVMLMG